MQVLCDTSFLMVLVEKPIKHVDRIEHEFGKLDFIVPDIVVGELKRLAEKAGPKRAMMAKTAIEIVKAKFKEVRVRRKLLFLLFFFCRSFRGRGLFLGLFRQLALDQPAV